MPGTSTVSAPIAKSRRAVPAKRAPLSKTAQVAKNTPPVPQAVNGVSPFEIMAGRIANRVAEMAENVTFVERQQRFAEPEQPQSNGNNSKRPPRKLEIRLPNAGTNGVQFSAPFLDNTLAKMLSLQNRMLKTGSEIAASDASESVKREQFEQSAELSRIIALICAEKARQGT